MIVSHRWDIIESLCGTGTVYRGQQPIATVQYRLEVRHTMPGMRSASGSHVLEGGDDVSGQFEVLTGRSHDAIDDPDLLVLQLEDGRQLSFYPDEIGSTLTMTAAGALN